MIYLYLLIVHNDVLLSRITYFKKANMRDGYRMWSEVVFKAIITYLL